MLVLGVQLGEVPLIHSQSRISRNDGNPILTKKGGGKVFLALLPPDGTIKKKEFVVAGKREKKTGDRALSLFRLLHFPAAGRREERVLFGRGKRRGHWHALVRGGGKMGRKEKFKFAYLAFPIQNTHEKRQHEEKGGGKGGGGKEGTHTIFRELFFEESTERKR